jgi:hypothetical protein
LFCGLFSSNHSIIEFIAQVAPDANIPSKNHDANDVTPNISCTGEYKKIPKKNPTHVEQHIMQANMSARNTKNPCVNNNGIDAFLLIKFLGPLKMLP